jgi:hypothetical protein
MRIIGVMTEDFQFFYRLVRRLKERDEPFVSLGFGDPLPYNVRVIITTPCEKVRAPSTLVAASDDPDTAINQAKALMKGRHFHTLVVGIDPGRTTGIAVVGNGKVLLTDTVDWPEGAVTAVERLTSGLDYDEMLVRIGHGDRTIRNRIIHALWGLADRVEIVDETNTTRRTLVPDIDAAILISRTMGEELETAPEVDPTPGEVREIQRQSRLASEGQFTIPTELARRVATGEMNMDDALAWHASRKDRGSKDRVA